MCPLGIVFASLVHAGLIVDSTIDGIVDHPRALNIIADGAGGGQGRLRSWRRGFDLGRLRSWRRGFDLLGHTCSVRAVFETNRILSAARILVAGAVCPLHVCC